MMNPIKVFKQELDSFIDQKVRHSLNKFFFDSLLSETNSESPLTIKIVQQGLTALRYHFMESLMIIGSILGVLTVVWTIVLIWSLSNGS